jgi:hypothetical protein
MTEGRDHPTNIISSLENKPRLSINGFMFSTGQEQRGEVWEPPNKATLLRILRALERKIVTLFCSYSGDGEWFVSTSAVQ